MARTDSGIFIQSSQKEITLLRRQNDGKGVTIWEEGCEHAVSSLAFIEKKGNTRKYTQTLEKHLLPFPKKTLLRLVDITLEQRLYSKC